ncbi:MAG: GerMN domain-containing protein [Actinobacteria bacterium]|nr:GerMN domain-containing protein [Actinomycetota bacterium]MBI3686492.1 GerMN domain-containing protein [Actinomycetota bacterium]
MMRRFSVLVAAMLPLAACGNGGSTTPTPSPGAASSNASVTPGGTPTGAATTTVRTYFIRNEKVAPVARTVSGTAVAKAAMEQLVAGPTASEKAAGLTSSVPAGTKVLGISITNGTATVDLSATYTSGGGSLSMQSRVAQVVYTLTQFPTITRVKFSIDGTPVTAIGGEGVVVDPPQTRADWESLTPEILVESPLPGEKVTSPFTATGTANTFEATYQYRLRGPSGAILTKGSGMATSGTGTRGTFAQPIAYAAGSSGNGMLEMFALSAKDGAEISLYQVPIVLG